MTDKQIVGGLCWGIQMCNVDVDVDLFHSENLKIGQKMYVELNNDVDSHAGHGENMTLGH